MSTALSKLLAPLKKNPPLKNSTEFLTAHGFIHQSTAGVYDLLPLGLRVLQKLETIIRRNLNRAECQELALSTLVNPEIWHQSGRLSKETKDENKEFLFTDKRKHLLAPTAEEQITMLVKNVPLKSLPLSYYQITRKFRNELRPRRGLLRTREFVMKDLYTFDADHASAVESYTRVRAAYDRIFSDIGLPVVVAEADSGDMGGDLSHEYHYLHKDGEDTLVICNSCEYTANLETAQSVPADAVETELITNQTTNARHVPKPGDLCINCHSPLEFHASIEVGHTFQLGTRYTEPLKAMISTRSGQQPLQMGCYGIGVSRLVSAISELSIDSHGLVWPAVVAPYTCAVLSKDQNQAKQLADWLGQMGVDSVYEDRTNQLGYAIRDAREKGFPYTVIAKGEEVEILFRDGREGAVTTKQGLLDIVSAK